MHQMFLSIHTNVLELVSSFNSISPEKVNTIGLVIAKLLSFVQLRLKVFFADKIDHLVAILIIQGLVLLLLICVLTSLQLFQLIWKSFYWILQVCVCLYGISLPFMLY